MMAVWRCLRLLPIETPISVMISESRPSSFNEPPQPPPAPQPAKDSKPGALSPQRCPLLLRREEPMKGSRWAKRDVGE